MDPVWCPRLDPSSPEPLARQIERAVAQAVSTGRLRPGDRLPSTRALATSTGVGRNTATAAYRELRAQGWVTTRPGGRTEIAAGTPIATVPRARPPAPAAPPAPPPKWPLGAGEPDPRRIPVASLARVVRRALRRPSVLGYQDPGGHPAFLAAVAGWLRAARGVEGAWMSCRGAQQGLDLAARALIRPGDSVGVEALGYPPAREALVRAGARLVVLPIDEHGLRVDAVEKALADGPLRAVYTTPHHQYPTTVTLAPPRRTALLALARDAGFTILEDDYDHEFHYEGPPRLPLAATDPTGVVLYIGTFSKVLAPGIRLGFVRGHPKLIAEMTAIRRASDRQGDAVWEHAIAEWIDDGELQRHLRRMRGVYRARRDALVTALQRHLSHALDVRAPTGGIALWAPIHAGVDQEAWLGRAKAAGVELRPGRWFSATNTRVDGLRLVFSRLDERELTAAVKALAGALPEPHGPTPRDPRRRR